jgi:hypothetical protein
MCFYIFENFPGGYTPDPLKYAWRGGGQRAEEGMERLKMKEREKRDTEREVGRRRKEGRVTGLRS